MNQWIALVFPVLIPFAFGILCLVFQKQVMLQKIFTIISMTGFLGSTFYIFYETYFNKNIMVLNLGNWSPPFGIVFVADILSAIMLAFAAVASFTVALYAIFYMDKLRVTHLFFAFYNFLIVGVAGSFSTGDIFNLYVFFEVMLISSYALVTLGNNKAQLIESFKYTATNLVASAFFVVGVGVLYGMVGSLNMADIAHKVTQASFLTGVNKGIFLIVGIIFLVVFGVKGGIFPLYYWLPGTYVVPPTPVSAIFGGLLTKVGVYCILRVFSLIFYRAESATGTNYLSLILIIISGFTMLFGVFGAIIQYNFKKILAHHIISQVGYMILGIGLGTIGAIAGAILHIAHNIIVKTALFLVSGVHEKLTGTNDIKKTGGLAYKAPFLATLFLISSLALAGLPPLSGFFSKFILIKGGIEQIIRSRQLYLYVIIVVALFTSLLTLLSMIKIWIFAFWGKCKISFEKSEIKYGRLIPSIAIFAAIALGMGLFAEFFYDVAIAAATQLKNPDLFYIKSVLEHQIPHQ